jgi:predicted esterase
MLENNVQQCWGYTVLSFGVIVVTVFLVGTAAVGKERPELLSTPLAEQYGHGSYLREPDLSPDGSKVAAVQWSDDAGSELVVEDFSNGDARVVLRHTANARRLEWCKWKTEVQLICATTTSRDRSSKRLMSVNVDGTEEKDLIDFVKILHMLPDDPTHVLVDRSGAGTLDVTNGRFRRLGLDWERTSPDAIWDANAESRVLNFSNGWGVRPSARGDWVTLHMYRRPYDWFRPVALDEQANAVFYIELLNGRLALHAMSLDADRSRRLVHAEPFAHVMDVTTIGKPSRIATAVVVNGTATYKPLDPRVAMVQSTAQRSFPSATVDVLSEDWNKRYYLLFVRDRGHVGTYYRFDATEQRLDAFRATHPNVTERMFLAPRTQLDLSANDGHAAVAYLTLPPGGTLPFALVVVPAGSSSAPDSFVPFLVMSGYAVIEHPPAPVPPDDESVATWTLTSAEIDAAVGELVRTGTVDPDRVCAVGHANDAYVAFMTASERPSLFRCVVGIQTVIEFEDHASLGLLWRDLEISAPVLLLHGRSGGQAEKLGDNLEDMGASVELIEYDDASFDEMPYRVDRLARLGKFLRDHLRP